ncbi:MAG: division/cell wall cluster transcriptional repressor MraZ [Clostridia bacterium]|nr:division/cell wall cluster transcriptional repressor MraZ [Clostridia bacterium]MDD4386904.1 division/cell wall cluster transcriptional repressor MraZ [Clostridia bacterium]
MLLGEYNHNVDEKGRVSVPAKFRDDLGASFIVTKGLDNCLFIYSKTEWNTFETKLKDLPLTNPNARNFIRFFFSGATECELDKQGRINIPQNLREYAGLNKDLSIIGVSTRVEIWDREKWNTYTSSDNMDLNEIAIQMSNLGI